jgi:hypothetical protein
MPVERSESLLFVRQEQHLTEGRRLTFEQEHDVRHH